MRKQKFNRRQFLKKSALTAASLSVWSTLKAQPNAPANINARVIGANDDIRVAVIGFNSRGQDHLKGMQEVKGVRIVALCDVDSNVLGREVKKFEDKKQPVTGYQDIRRLLENKDIDAVTIATPNHWHSLAAIWGIQAGKDVYVEKPVSHNVWEGRQLVTAARKYERIVQTGTQCRSSPGLAEAVAWVQAGNLGKIKVARGLCYKRRASIGKTTGPQPVPESVNYNLWTGPAPMEPLRRAKLHYDWHWVWPTGNGDLGNQGIHQMDIARWFLGEAELSPRVLSVGGRVGYVDDGNTPNTLVVFHDYPTAPLIFEVRGLPQKSGAKAMDNYRGADVGVVVDCEHGYIVNPSYTRVNVFDKDGKQIKTFDGKASHYENFIAAVRSRKSSDLHADILQGHISSALCHTGNISYRLGKVTSPDELRSTMRANADLADSLNRMQEHLGANAVNLTETPLMLGTALTMNPPSERFTSNADANALLAASYREPFVVPEKV
ncbi:MAG TPA: Gfo/Idh/MocA family oxidoreductase [Verrucomicrobiae bacterium]|nr:Gfo/Idh/MocA family oxidoreductase [Verrucomicrobiae bacterium]